MYDGCVMPRLDRFANAITVCQIPQRLRKKGQLPDIADRRLEKSVDDRQTDRFTDTKAW